MPIANTSLHFLHFGYTCLINVNGKSHLVLPRKASFFNAIHELETM